ncbi:MAG: hypothetical protein NTW28_20290 [Candidatus Solibacter sp.]|nr:hypothetical protein [Candidatus Solibacter sp.]
MGGHRGGRQRVERGGGGTGNRFADGRRGFKSGIGGGQVGAAAGAGVEAAGPTAANGACASGGTAGSAMAVCWGIRASGAIAAPGRTAPMTGSEFGTDRAWLINGTCGVVADGAKAGGFSAGGEATAAGAVEV